MPNLPVFPTDPQYNVYKGARYVPLIMGAWDATVEYEPLSIVIVEGNSYTSKWYVPAGVPVTNTEYWVLTGNYNGQISSIQSQISEMETDIAVNQADIAEMKPLTAASEVWTEWFRGKKIIIFGASNSSDMAGIPTTWAYQLKALLQGIATVDINAVPGRKLVGENGTVAALLNTDLSTYDLCLFSMSRNDYFGGTPVGPESGYNAAPTTLLQAIDTVGIFLHQNFPYLPFYWLGMTRKQDSPNWSDHQNHWGVYEIILQNRTNYWGIPYINSNLFGGTSRQYSVGDLQVDGTHWTMQGAADLMWNNFRSTLFRRTEAFLGTYVKQNVPITPMENATLTSCSLVSTGQRIQLIFTLHLESGFTATTPYLPQAATWDIPLLNTVFNVSTLRFPANGRARVTQGGNVLWADCGVYTSGKLNINYKNSGNIPTAGDTIQGYIESTTPLIYINGLSGAN